MADIPHSGDVDDVLRRLLRDDPTGWTTLVRDYSGVLIGVAKRTFAASGYKPVAQDAEDVVSVVWANVLAHDRRIVRRCLEQGRWIATLYTLVRNRAVDITRGHRVQTVPYDEARVPEPEPETDADQGMAETAVDTQHGVQGGGRLCRASGLPSRAPKLSLKAGGGNESTIQYAGGTGCSGFPIFHP